MQLCDNDACTLSSFLLRSLWCLLTVFFWLATITVEICSRNITNMCAKKKTKTTTESTESMIKKLYLPSHRPAAHLQSHRNFLPIPCFRFSLWAPLPAAAAQLPQGECCHPVLCSTAWCHNTLLCSELNLKSKHSSVAFPDRF